MFNTEENPNLFKIINWDSDWKGYEIGYPEILEIGLYSYQGMYMYINMETLQILEAWFEEEEDEY